MPKRVPITSAVSGENVTRLICNPTAQIYAYSTEVQQIVRAAPVVAVDQQMAMHKMQTKARVAASTSQRAPVTRHSLNNQASQ